MIRLPNGRMLTLIEMQALALHDPAGRRKTETAVARFVTHEVPRTGPADPLPSVDVPNPEYNAPRHEDAPRPAPFVPGEMSPVEAQQVRVLDALLDELSASPEHRGQSRRDIYGALRTAVVDVTVNALQWSTADLGRTGPITPTRTLSAVQLDRVGASLAGESLQLGFGAVENMAVRARQIVHPEHGAGTELNVRLTQQRGLDVRKLFEAGVPGAAPAGFRIERATFHDGATELWATGAFKHSNMLDGELLSQPGKAYTVVEPGRFTLDFAPSARDVPAAYVNRVRVRVFGDTHDARAQALQEALGRIGAQDVVADATAEDVARWQRLSLLHMVDPTAHDRVLRAGVATTTVAELDAALATANVDAARVMAARTEEVFPGQVTLVDPALGAAYRALGLEMLIVGTSGVDSLVDMLTGPGLHASAERFAKGMHREGVSTHADFDKGGAEYAFARAVPTKAIDESKGYGSWTSGEYLLVSAGDPLEALLSRTDWHAYDCDNYGATTASWHLASPYGNGRKQPPKVFFDDRRVLGSLMTSLTDDRSTGWAASNELAFRTGIPAHAFTHIATFDPDRRDVLLAKLRGAGVTEIAGKPVEDAVVLAANHGELGKEVGLRP